MKVKMLTSMAGANFTLSVGEVTEKFSDAEAKRMAAAGICEIIEQAPPKQKRTVKRKSVTAETASKAKAENRA